MGSTVTTGKMAAAFRMTQGRTCFVLFERVHETNVSPRIPEWQCGFIGTAHAAVRQIFGWASSCEGGMLRGRDGTIKPENYIAAWLRELANPVILPDRPIRLYASDSSSAPLPPDNEALLAGIEEQGREDFAQTIRSGGVAELSLHAHADVLLALFGNERAGRLTLPAWRILKGHDRPHDPERDCSLGFAPEAAPAKIAPPLQAIRINEHDRLVQGADGRWANEGWPYSIIGQRISAMSDQEIETPGYCRRAIPLLREAIETAPWPPEGTIVRLDRSACKNRRALEQFDYRVSHEVLHVPDGIAALPWSKEIGAAVAYIPREAVSWEIPEAMVA
ncbi:hypothetical protein [Acidisoma sp. 7E03]